MVFEQTAYAEIDEGRHRLDEPRLLGRTTSGLSDALAAELGRSSRRRGDRVQRDRAIARSARRAASRRSRPSRRVGARRHRRHRALPAPGRGLGGRAARRERRRHDGHRLGEVAGLQPPRPRCDRTRSEDARALPLPDQGALAGPGARARRTPAERAQAGDLRRRHARRATLADPQVVEPHPHESGHAPRRRSSPSRPLGRRARQPAVRDRRRGARLSRRLRFARSQRPTPASAASTDLRLRAAVPARLGDDCERG